MKKLFILLICIFMLASCGNAEQVLTITESEAGQVLSDLLPKSYDINVIFFGEGLSHTDDESSETVYVEVTDTKYTNIEQIKLDAEEVFAKTYLNGIYVSVFEGTTATETGDGIDTLSARYKVIGGKLKINKNSKVFEIRRLSNPENIKIEKQTAEYVIVSADCMNQNEKINIKFTLTKQNDKWLFAGPTY